MKKANLGVCIRPAIGSDFEWIADIMEQSLTPFYKGDHRAHAKRILNTHVKGGVDLLGHFSSGQHMLIAELDSRKVGMIHLVEKCQGVLKICPIITTREVHGKGVGALLLKFAEDYAREKGLRQIYGTVACVNRNVLDFMTKHGYIVTGIAKRQYSLSHDEVVFYKQIEPVISYVLSNILVVPFMHEKHDKVVRKMILDKLSCDFDGLDDDWVSRLFDGTERAKSNDVNTKYKIVYVAELDNEVVGAFGATPKKGEPIKIMPIVAKTREAFEALVVNIQDLFMNASHKIYIHMVPEAWQAICLQLYGWELECIFPGGYSRNSIVYQWGYTFKKERGRR